MSPSDCPFKIGQVVYYRPAPQNGGSSSKEAAMEIPKVGEAVRIAKIDGGKYILVDGYSHPGVGLYWTDFSET